MPQPGELARLIEAALAGADVEVRDLTGAGDHFEVRVVSGQFSGRRMQEQHDLVYAPLHPLLQRGELHAVALRTYSPEQWARRGKG